MATLAQEASAGIVRIGAFLGLNENPDGDTHLRMGELSRMRNFRITQDHHLQVRPGCRTLLRLRDEWDRLRGPLAPGGEAPRLGGAWSGPVDGRERTIAAFGGVIFEVAPDRASARSLGRYTGTEARFFGFGGRAYLLSGHEYLGWDGGEGGFRPVEGYVPTVMTALTPEGLGTPLEKVNRLTGRRKAEYSPDGKATVFHLPEKGADAVEHVTGTAIGWTADPAAGTVTFASAPPTGTNTLVITYRKGNGTRADVEGMRFAELFNGRTDARVFLGGDGTNRILYSGTELASGRPSAEYFPDLYEAAVGGANDPVTGMVRHFGRLLVFQRESAWSLTASTVTGADGVLTPAFSVLPVNRHIGSEAPGEVRLLENDPVTLSHGGLYLWRSEAAAGGDERSAVRLSDRVRASLSAFDFASVRTFNHRYRQELWIFGGERALLYHYAADAWYLYTDLPLAALLEGERGALTGFAPDGRVMDISRRYRSDDGVPIDAFAATGSMDLGRDERLKFSPMLYVALQPESRSRVTVGVETNRRSDYPRRTAAAGFASFDHVDFRHWSFSTNRKPQVRRLKLRVRRATYLKLIFTSRSASATATVLAADLRLHWGASVR